MSPLQQQWEAATTRQRRCMLEDSFVPLPDIPAPAPVCLTTRCLPTATASAHLGSLSMMCRRGSDGRSSDACTFLSSQGTRRPALSWAVGRRRYRVHRELRTRSTVALKKAQDALLVYLVQGAGQPARTFCPWRAATAIDRPAMPTPPGWPVHTHCWIGRPSGRLRPQGWRSAPAHVCCELYRHA